MIGWTEADGRARRETATLEDIAPTGACLYLEESIPVGTKVSIYHEKGKYEGTIKYSTPQQIGYLLGIAFEPGHGWSRMDFRPSHLLAYRRQ
jgi:hypothetical protein